MNRYNKLLAGLLGISLTAASMMPLSADAEALCAVDPQRTVMQESGNEAGPVTAEAAVETLWRHLCVLQHRESIYREKRSRS